MPVVVALAIVLFALLLAIALMPVALVQRYRVVTTRRPARGWLAALNVAGLLGSALTFIAGAAITNLWVPHALAYTLMGSAVGCALGGIGLALTRWEPTPRALFYTPNRWLVLSITLVVTGRILYGVWRGWHTWRAGVEGASLLVTAGVAGSLAAGAVAIGYYLTFWLGVRRRLRRHVRGQFMSPRFSRPSNPDCRP